MTTPRVLAGLLALTLLASLWLARPDPNDSSGTAGAVTLIQR
jgi:hypothetical protein